MANPNKSKRSVFFVLPDEDYQKEPPNSASIEGDCAKDSKDQPFQGSPLKRRRPDDSQSPSPVLRRRSEIFGPLPQVDEVEQHPLERRALRSIDEHQHIEASPDSTVVKVLDSAGVTDRQPGSRVRRQAHKNRSAPVLEPFIFTGTTIDTSPNTTTRTTSLPAESTSDQRNTVTVDQALLGDDVTIFKAAVESSPPLPIIYADQWRPTPDQPHSRSQLVPTHTAQPQSPFLRILSPEQRAEIYRYIFPVDTYIIPLQAQGTLINGVTAKPFNDENVAGVPNLDTGVMRVCNEMHEETTTLLYGSNQIISTDAGVFLWWINRIGASNTAKISRLALTMYTQWKDERETGLVPSEEETWYRVLLRLGTAQNLASLHISVDSWEDLRAPRHRANLRVGVSQAWELTEWRRRAWEQLIQLRGIDHVVIEQNYCYFADDNVVSRAVRAMQGPRGPPVVVRQPHRPSLGALIDNIRALRMAREAGFGN